MRKRRVLVLGASGMLGQEFTHALAHHERFTAIACDRRRADVTNLAMLRRVMRATRPDVVINCAAEIDVDWCEAHPLEAWRTNALGPGNALRALADTGHTRSVFVQISTAYVFGNDKNAFAEDDLPHPVNVYGSSKLGGEAIAAAEANAAGIPYLIVRTAWLYSHFRKTFIDHLAGELLAGKTCVAFSDQFGLPVWTRDFVRGTIRLLHRRRVESGIYHAVSGSRRRVSRYDIARVVAGALSCDRRLVRPGRKRTILRVPRPKSAFLINTRGLPMPGWQASLRQYMRERYYPKRSS